MMKALVSTLALAACAGAALAQTDRLYMPDSFNTNQLFVIQGGTVIATGPSVGSGGQAPIAVAGDVRLAGYYPGATGGQYDLNASPLGPTYANSGGRYHYDGTTNGTNNFAVSWDDGTVYQYDRDWGSPTPLFNSGTGGFGITYDSRNNSLWITNRYDGQVREFSLGGSLMSTISAGGHYDGIAYEPSTDTLWLNYAYSNTIEQFNKGGGYMQTVSVSGTTSGAIYGYSMEFDIPAPGGLALLGLGGLAAARRRRA